MSYQDVIIGAEHSITAARSAIYQGLSTLFFYPCNGQTNHPAVIAATFAQRMALLPHDLSAALPLLAGLIQMESIADLELRARFTSIFDNCSGRAAVSLYEKDYGNGEAKAVWEEVVRFYEHFGLGFDVRDAHDWPDHIGTELEFMHYLTFLEATAEKPGDGEIYRRAQGDFLVRRVGRWAPRFAAQLGGIDGNAPYGLFARLMAAYVEADLRYLGRTCEAGSPWIPQREAQAGLAQKDWIPIIPIEEMEDFP